VSLYGIPHSRLSGTSELSLAFPWNAPAFLVFYFTVLQQGNQNSVKKRAGQGVFYLLPVQRLGKYS
jgi:hypothetical protein